MKQIEGMYECNCGNSFIWKTQKLNNKEVIVSWENERLQNVKNFFETECQYIIEIECPYCKKRNFIEKDK